MTWIKDVKDEIVTVLGTKTGSGQPLSEVHERLDVSTDLTYPAAFILFQDHSIEFLDSESNNHILTFLILVITKKFDTDAEQDNFIDAIYDVANTLDNDANFTLSGQSHKTQISVTGNIKYDGDGLEPYIKYGIQVQVEKAQSIL